jgi:hypothetical protein
MHCRRWGRSKAGGLTRPRSQQPNPYKPRPVASPG